LRKTRERMTHFSCCLTSPLGNWTGMCGEVLITLGLPSGWLRLLNVSINKMNFSASMGLYSL